MGVGEHLVLALALDLVLLFVLFAVVTYCLLPIDTAFAMDIDSSTCKLVGYMTRHSMEGNNFLCRPTSRECLWLVNACNESLSAYKGWCMARNSVESSHF